MPRPNVPGPVYIPHRPMPVPTTWGRSRYSTPRDFHRVVIRRHIYRHWVFEPVPRYYYPGYVVIDGYPWYVHRGYRYRYNPVETCTYDLVNSDDDTIVRSYGEYACNLAYDQCAADRDASNAGNTDDEQYYCAEHVEDEYANDDDTTFDPNANQIPDARQTTIENYLNSASNQQAYNDAVAGRLGTCSVWKLKHNPNGCTYRMKVDGQNYPDDAGLVCSAPAQAAIINCNVGTEQENLGCILKNAVLNGHCI